MSLRRPDTCAACGADLSQGTKAEWDSVERRVNCLDCVEKRNPVERAPAAAVVPDRPAEPDAEGVAPAVDPLSNVEIDHGAAGLSARKEYERRQAKNAKRIEDKWGTGRIGRIAKALSDDPQTTKAWKEGAIGEERVARVLSEQLGTEAVLLHDRKVPGTRGNIDHIAIGSSGVWIIDAKRYTGKVERRDVGGFFKTDFRLFVGGRDRSKIVDGMQWQYEAVLQVLDDEGIPIHQVLTFVDAEWPLFMRKPLQFGDVRVSGPKRLAEMIAEVGPLDPAEIERVARRLAEALPANR